MRTLTMLSVLALLSGCAMFKPRGNYEADGTVRTVTRDQQKMAVKIIVMDAQSGRAEYAGTTYVEASLADGRAYAFQVRDGSGLQAGDAIALRFERHIPCELVKGRPQARTAPAPSPVLRWHVLFPAQIE